MRDGESEEGEGGRMIRWMYMRGPPGQAPKVTWEYSFGVTLQVALLGEVSRPTWSSDEWVSEWKPLYWLG